VDPRVEEAASQRRRDGRDGARYRVFHRDTERAHWARNGPRGLYFIRAANLGNFEPNTALIRSKSFAMYGNRDVLRS